jgi:hypothetical protein
MEKLLVLVVALVIVGTAAWAQASIGTGQWLPDCWMSKQRMDNGGAARLSASGKSLNDVSDSMNAMKYEFHVIGAVRIMFSQNWFDLTNISVDKWLAVVGIYLDRHPEQWDVPFKSFRALGPWLRGTNAGVSHG